MASRRKVQEDKNVQTLRELAKLPANRECFDCHQRGPTYVNVTIGSFVCTSCSGILRGLNPPHRVKSITMTTFTSEEIDFIKQRGNEYCKYVWLGTHDHRTNMESDVRDEQCSRDLMIQKYERKRWYVDPETAMKKMQQDQEHQSHSLQMQQQRPQQSSQQSFVVLENNTSETKSLSTITGESSTSLVLQNNKQQNNSSWHSIENTTSSQNQEKTSVDFFNDFGNDPFGGRRTTSPSVPSKIPEAPKSKTENASANGNFANFESAFTENQVSVGQGSTTLSPPAIQGSGKFAVQGFTSPTSSTPGGSFVSQNSTISQSPSQQMYPPSADRYAALADLDSLFHYTTQPTTTAAPIWSSTGIGISTVFDSPTVPNSAYGTAASNPFSTNTAPTWTQPATVSTQQQNYFLGANPFQVAPQPAGFGVQPPAQNISGFGQFGTQGSVATSEIGFGAFGGGVTSSASFGSYTPASLGVGNLPNGMPTNQFGVQNGGFGLASSTAGWPVTNMVPAGGHSVGTTWNFGNGQQAQVNVFPGNKLGTWPQQQPFQPSANPFSVASGPSQPVKPNPGNPFL
ncbi:arf-GAP domain and FG repeat-containing protein 1-like isoform X5 [Tachypleus tridentatus]|uniref:arf-GAP domain and FG repeat-containing protein 1-like isoform X5 n=1 Tax=Tachypleus tridentatus TaxID=6853 RepID=UPI003FD3F487